MNKIANVPDTKKLEGITMATAMVAQYKYYVLLCMVIGIILVLLFYVSYKFGLKTQNCTSITKNMDTLSMIPITNSFNKPLSSYFIKTAYNCFCSGKFKNDYVDVCALQNCANYGVRALDFQIFSLNNKPIISASTVNSNKYKEIYNYIPFYSGMQNVKKYFLNTNTNKNDPLFLIFRLYTTNSPVYDIMGDTLNEIFGYGTPEGNRIYIKALNQTLDKITLNTLMKKVIIIVDSTNGDPAKFNSSKLHLYTTMTLGTQTNKIYRENDVLNTSHNLQKLIDLSNNINIVYPNLEYSNSNYDFVTTGINNCISFIGMNFQNNDIYLKEYNNSSFFNNSAFIDKTTTMTNLCANSTYSIMTNCSKYIPSKK
jgi:hypothetical protein